MNEMASMNWSLTAIVLMEIFNSVSCKVLSQSKITVALSERKPFVIVNQNGQRSGLDISIIENFAQTLKRQVEYINVHESLNTVFAKKDFNAIENVLRFDLTKYSINGCLIFLVTLISEMQTY